MLKGKKMVVTKLPSVTDVFTEERRQEFLDALRQRVSQRIAVPETEIPVIKNSEHRHLIFNCLANNWSAERVHAYLMQTVQVDIPVMAIQEYRDSLDKDAFLPISYLQSKFRELDIEVDAIGELARLLRLQAERLDMALFLESCTHPLSAIVGQQIHEYWDLLKQYLAIQKGLGFFAVDTTAHNVLPANVTPIDIPTIRHLIELAPRRSETIDADVRELR